ncbi:MAG: agmatinase [Dehalococcoidia bacterium]
MSPQQDGLSLRRTQVGDIDDWPETRAVPRSFFKSPLCNDLDELNADIAFLGVPYDQGTYARPGARYGPNGIRDADRIYEYMDKWEDKEGLGYFDIDAGGVLLKGVTMADCGDVTILPSDVEKNFAKLTKAVRRILDRGAFPVIIGGDHSITFPSVRGFDGYEPLDVVHFDAHIDFSHELQGTFYHHGCPIRRCFDLPNVKNITSLGIRMAREEVYADAMKKGVKVITTEQFRRMGPEATIEQVPQGENIYLTVDVDVMDPVQIPGTGTPAPGGLYYFEMRDALIALAKRGRIVGVDFVEVAPPYDHAEVTTRFAAKLIIDLLSVLFPSKA